MVFPFAPYGVINTARSEMGINSGSTLASRETIALIWTGSLISGSRYQRSRPNQGDRFTARQRAARVYTHLGTSGIYHAIGSKGKDHERLFDITAGRAARQ